MRRSRNLLALTICLAMSSLFSFGSCKQDDTKEDSSLRNILVITNDQKRRWAGMSIHSAGGSLPKKNSAKETMEFIYIENLPTFSKKLEEVFDDGSMAIYYSTGRRVFYLTEGGEQDLKFDNIEDWLNNAARKAKEPGEGTRWKNVEIFAHEDIPIEELKLREMMDAGIRRFYFRIFAMDPAVKKPAPFTSKVFHANMKGQEDLESLIIVEMAEGNPVYRYMGRSFSQLVALKNVISNISASNPINRLVVKEGVPLQVFLNWYMFWSDDNVGTPNSNYELHYSNIP